MALAASDKRLVIAAFDAIEREAGRAKLSPRVQGLVDRAREVVKSQCRKQRQAMQAGEQLKLPLPMRRPPSIQRKKRGGRHRYARYPFHMVEDARAMRANGYCYREIAEAVNKYYGTQVSSYTIRDWTQGWYRMMG